MNKILRYLRQPYPAGQEDSRIYIILIASLLVFFVLVMFQPFGTNEYHGSIPLLSFGFACVTALCLCTNVYLFPFLFKNYYHPDSWTVWKNILSYIFIICLISVGNSIYSIFVYTAGFSWSVFQNLLVHFLIYTFSIGIIPMMISHFLQQNKYLKRNLEEAQKLNQLLASRTPVESLSSYSSDKVVLMGNTKESIELHPEQLLFVEASGNYVKVFYTENDLDCKQKMLRATIKQIEETLQSYSFIVRCHRAFLVNINQITTAKGNSQGYKLLFKHTQEEVPVSRAYTKELQDKL